MKVEEFVLSAEQSREPALVAGADGKILFANGAWLNLFGYELRELIGRPVLDLVYPEDRTRSIMRQSALMAGAAPRAFENRYLGKDGKARWLIWTAELNRESGAVIGFAQDVTERREQQRLFDELISAVSRQSGGAFFEAVTRELAERFQLGRVAIARTIDDHRARTISVWSTRGSETGFEYQLAGSPCQQLIKTGNLKILESPKSFYPSDPRFSENADECYMGMPIRSVDEQRVIGVLWIIHSQSLRRETALEWILRSLSIQIAAELDRAERQKEYERLLADQQMRLVGTAKMAAVGEMAAGIAHEINNPICVIAARTMILRDLAQAFGSPNGDKVRDACERIAVMAERISKIVRSMRTIARDGRGDPFQPFEVYDILNDVIELSRARFANAMIRLEEPSPQARVRVECRPVQISQLMLNLLANAYDAVRGLDEKWVKVGLRVRNSMVEISVDDSGPGIRPELAEKIMMPFFTTKDVGHGTGLGLSISRAIAEDHGGNLELDSSVGNTRFVVRLPLKKDKPLKHREH